MKSPERLERELEKIEQERGEDGLTAALPLKMADVRREVSRVFTTCQQKLSDANTVWLADTEEENLSKIRSGIKSALSSWLQAMDKAILSCEVIVNFDFSEIVRKNLFTLLSEAIRPWEEEIANKTALFPPSVLPVDFNPKIAFRKADNYLTELIARVEIERGPRQLLIFSPDKFPELHGRVPIYPPKTKSPVLHGRGKKPQ